MTENVQERRKYSVGSNGQGDSEGVRYERTAQSSSKASLPPIVFEKKSHSSALAVPEIRALDRDRQSRREAQQTQRELARIAREGIVHRMKIQAVLAVTTYVVEAVDQAQEEMMNIYHSKTRHEGMDEVLAQTIAQSLQQMGSQALALSELHYKNQTNG
jgi:hypothetical protein